MQLIKIREAQEKLGVSKAFLLRKIKAGEFPIYRLGDKTIRLDLDEILICSRSPGSNRDARVDARP